MSAWTDRLWYNVKDALGKKSYAESQRDKYKKVIDSINEKLDSMTDFEDMVEIFERDISSMEMNPYSANGNFHWTFIFYDERKSPIFSLYDIRYLCYN